MRKKALTVQRVGSVLFLVLLLLSTNSFLWPYKDETGTLYVSYPSALLFNLFSILCFSVLLLNKNVWIRKSGEIFLFSVLFMDIAYLRITGSSFGYYDALNMTANVHYAGPAISSFFIEFVWAFIITGSCFAGIHLLRRHCVLTFRPHLAVVPLLAAALFFGYAFVSKNSIDVLPAPYRTPLSLTLASLEAHKPAIPREPVAERPACPQVKHVFLIVDESITGTDLSINGAPAEMTPFLNQHQDSLLNFGNATSFTNYSAGSNICLISGLRTQQLPDKTQRALRQPSLFQYAKAAGYKTYYIDAQTSGSTLQNYLTKHDRAAIDSFVQPADWLPAVPLHQRDDMVSELLVRLSKTDDRSFVYVNKVGAHWPYKKSYPPDLRRRSAKGVESNYQRAITWSVDRFWKHMLTGISANDSCTVIYTSDHGEHVGETGATAAGHGTLYKPHPKEGIVPLIVYDRSGRRLPFKKSINAASHEQIFPTTLLLMGYLESFVTAQYGCSLFDTLKQNRRWFFSGDVFGRSRTYRTYLDP